ncbi:MAG TPA: phosphatidylglycerol lysyltransferase domain-containing protein [Acidimicrobiales bacterium]|nr:phosphatidylglycerol lysyltransferase domain-containing protein [Acidimicrobiales bacterium]
MSPPPPGALPDTARAELPIGGRAVVTSDLFLRDEATPSSSAAAEAVAEALRGVEGDGILVVAGNCFELTPRSGAAGAEAISPGAAVTGALSAHPGLCSAFRDFLDRRGEGLCRRIVLLPGIRDRAICHDKEAAAALEALGCEVALALDVAVETGSGSKTVRVEPGWGYDARSAFDDPTDPHDTPLAHHALTELFPALGSSRSGWLDGIDRLQDPAGLPRFVASRLFYRRLTRWAWWLLPPVVAVVLARLPGLWLYGAPVHLRGVNRLLIEVAAAVLLELVAAGILLAVLNHRVWTGPGSALLGPPAERVNDTAREAARAFVAAGGGGLVTGHSLRPEIASVGKGLFANTGACATVVEERRGLFGLPPVFAPSEQVAYVTIEGGADLHARLTVAHEQQAAGTLLERLACGPRRPALPLSVVGYYPGHPWPPVQDPVRQRRLVRRLVAALVAAIGVLDVVIALVPPEVRGRLHPYLGYVPLGVSAAAGALVGIAGMALILVARGLRRGHRLAWLVAVGVLAATSVLHIVREGQILGALASLAVLAALVWARGSFRARYEPAAVRTALLMLGGGALGVPLLVTAVVEFGIQFDRDHGPLPWYTAFAAAFERLVGIDSIALPHVASVFLDPAELAIGVGIAVSALLIGFRPVAARRRGRERASGGTVADGRGEEAGRARDIERAREVVRRRGSGTLDYFALRSDKRHFFARDGLVAYAIHNGVALVSPDPICPPEERVSLWAAFRAYADEHAWSVAVLGAGQEWLPVYHSSGMRDLYIGDEAVVDVRTLSLEGGAKKGLRQAVNRIAKYGYTISFHDPANADPELAAQLREVMVKSRRGGVERGFSMTLGRIFDPSDTGLLLAVAHGPEGEPVAFCQFVPAPGIEGYSLDLMRRDPGDHPNGLLDFILVRTIEHLRDEKMRGLGLNFAMMRAVLAGEAGSGLTTRVERFVLRRMSDSMQIESLWRFNAKFDPEWLPRYVVWDAAEHSLAAALAIARAESFWELPLIGRFLVPVSGADEPEPAAAP